MAKRLGILGAGRIGQVHARAIAQSRDAELAAISDPVPAAARAMADIYGCSIRTADEIITASDIDAVIIRILLNFPFVVAARRLRGWGRCGGWSVGGGRASRASTRAWQQRTAPRGSAAHTRRPRTRPHTRNRRMHAQGE